MSGLTSNPETPIHVPTTHKRRGHLYRLAEKPVIESGKWAVACFEVVALGRVQSLCVLEYTYEDGYGYREGDFTFFTKIDEALGFMLERVGQLTLPDDAPVENL